jgi:hypothetical protein
MHEVRTNNLPSALLARFIRLRAPPMAPLSVECSKLPQLVEAMQSFDISTVSMASLTILDGPQRVG